MKLNKAFLMFYFFLAGNSIYANENNKNEKPIVIVTASYNNRQWYKRNLNSILDQNYTNYKIIYIDDASTDGTYQLVKAHLREKDPTGKVILVHNEKRQGALANQYRAIHCCTDDTVIIIVDGDDWLAHKDVLTYINSVYNSDDIWLTYGQFQEWPSGEKGFCRNMPKYVVENESFRSYTHIPSHLRTFYAGLFKKIKKEDLLHDGEFFSMTGDMAAMIPMIEMAADHFKFIPNILLIYNANNSISDHRISRELQKQFDIEIRSRKKYTKLSFLFPEKENNENNNEGIEQ